MFKSGMSFARLRRVGLITDEKLQGYSRLKSTKIWATKHSHFIEMIVFRMMVFRNVQVKMILILHKRSEYMKVLKASHQ